MLRITVYVDGTLFGCWRCSTITLCYFVVLYWILLLLIDSLYFVFWFRRGWFAGCEFLFVVFIGFVVCLIVCEFCLFFDCCLNCGSLGLGFVVLLLFSSGDCLFVVYYTLQLRCVNSVVYFLCFVFCYCYLWLIVWFRCFSGSTWFVLLVFVGFGY